jgi:hypothetical protein
VREVPGSHFPIAHRPSTSPNKMTTSLPPLVCRGVKRRRQRWTTMRPVCAWSGARPAFQLSR